VGPKSGVDAVEKRISIALPAIEPRFLGFIPGSLVKYITYLERMKAGSLGAHRKPGSCRGRSFTSVIIHRKHH
jgi:hypothetical protein